MTPQSQFMVTAPISHGREAELRALLASLNESPGRVKTDNPVFPFAAFDRLHVARFVILEDPTVSDVTVYGLKPPEFPIYLVFLGDCDGDAEDFLAEAATKAEGGLRRIFSHCTDFDAGTSVLRWMLDRNTTAAAAYTNWIGRTVQQVKQDCALHDALRQEMRRDADKFREIDPQSLRRTLKSFVDAEQRAGRLPIAREKSTPLSWQLRNLAHLILVPLGGLLLAPFLIVASPVLIVMLRRREKRDPDIAPRPVTSHVQRLSVLEDHDVTNQFSAIGVLKPGLFRRALTTVFLVGLDYAARHIYKRGHLTRVRTIHFARWVFLDGKRRIYFASNYDGSLESYMDDFINKVGWGLNLVFSNGIGYPRTNWLVLQGCANEQHFKYFLRRHQRPTDVWYKAYPGLTAIDLDRNSRIREGLERDSMTDAEALAWSRLL